MHAVATSGLRVALQSDEIELILDEQGCFHDEVVWAFLRIEVDENEVGALERTDAAHPGILVDAAKIRQIEQRCAVVANGVVNRRLVVLGINRLRTQPLREVFRGALLKKEIGVDAVRITFQGKRAVL